MSDRDIVAVSVVAPTVAPALRAQRRLWATKWLHRPEPTEPPGPEDPDEDDVPPDPDRLPGEPIPPPIGDPPPNYAPQSVGTPMRRRTHAALTNRPVSRAPPAIPIGPI
jgi:hypothetical protein